MIIDFFREKQTLLQRRKSLEEESSLDYPSALKRDIVCGIRATSSMWHLMLCLTSSVLGAKDLYQNCLDEEYQNYDNAEDLDIHATIGGVNLSKLEALTTAAACDHDLIEELEYAFLYFGLCSYCVRVWLAEKKICQSNVVLEVRDMHPIETSDFENYDAAIFFFGYKLVSHYLQCSLRNMRAYFNFEFPEDQFSSATSSVIEYIRKTPCLTQFITENPQYTSILKLLEEYVSRYRSFPTVFQRINRLKTVVSLIEKEQKYLNTVDDYKSLLDENDLVQFSKIVHNKIEEQKYVSRDSLFSCNSLHDLKRLFRKELSDKELDEIISNEHPYICAQVAADCFEQNKWSDGFVFLQKALFCVFSYPNPFFHNKEAICGCVDALLMFRQLLFLDNCDSFEHSTGVSLFYVLYFYLKRAIVMCQKNLQCARMDVDAVPIDVVRIILYEVELADLIEEFANILINESLCENDIPRIAETHRASARKLLEDWGLFILSLSIEENLCTNYGDLRYTEFMMMIIEGEMAYSYSRGFFRVEESQIADYIQQLTRQYVEKDTVSPIIDSSSVNKTVVYYRDLSEHQQDQIRIATKKNNVSEFKNFFDANGVKVLYHFTDRENLQSIRKNGLLSLDYINRKKIISSTGGDATLQSADRSYNNEDYIHLSFVKRHPMGWRLKRENKNRDFVILKISPDVAYSESTVFSDINAANPNHIQGPEFSVLNRVNISSVNSKYSQQDSEEQEQKAAEVLVRRTIPINYILNLDNPETF
jgi:hypothetical protein